MVDFQTYKDANPDCLDGPGGLFGSKMPDNIFEADAPPSEPDLLLMPSEIVGFQLRTNKWSKISHSHISQYLLTPKQNTWTSTGSKTCIGTAAHSTTWS